MARKIVESLIVHCKAIFILTLTMVAAFDVNLECKGGHAVQCKQQMSAGERSCFEKRSWTEAIFYINIQNLAMKSSAYEQDFVPYVFFQTAP